MTGGPRISKLRVSLLTRQYPPGTDVWLAPGQFVNKPGTPLIGYARPDLPADIQLNLNEDDR